MHSGLEDQAFFILEDASSEVGLAVPPARCVYNTSLRGIRR